MNHSTKFLINSTHEEILQYRSPGFLNTLFTWLSKKFVFGKRANQDSPGVNNRYFVTQNSGA